MQLDFAFPRRWSSHRVLRLVFDFELQEEDIYFLVRVAGICAKAVEAVPEQLLRQFKEGLVLRARQDTCVRVLRLQNYT